MADAHPEGAATTNHESLPDVCAGIDRGGGVGYKGFFLIFTKQHVSLYVPRPLRYPDALLDLSAAADRIPNVLRIYLDFEHLRKEDLCSLPCSPNGARKADPPWFFLNASVQNPRKFGIAGQGTVLDTMTSILRRPWCVLELCCTDTKIIKTLVEFVDVVCKVQEKEFAAARQLLTYEFTCRASIQRWGFSVPTAPLTGSKISNSHVAEIRKSSAVLFALTEQSFNGHWIRAICVCAIRFDLSISMLGGLFECAKPVQPSMTSERSLWERIFFRQLGKSWSSSVSRAQRTQAEHQRLVLSPLVDMLIAKSLLPLYNAILREIVDHIY